MAVPFVGINPVSINPRNQLLDTTDLNRSIAGYRAGTDAAFDQQTNQLIGDALAKDDFAGAQAAAAKRGDISTNLQLRTAKAQQDQAAAASEKAAMERERALAQRFAAVAQAFDAEKDDTKASAMLDGLYKRDPRILEAVKKNLPPEFHNDPRAVSRYWTAIARGYVDPDEKRLRDATIDEKTANAELHRAQATAAAAKPSDIQKRGKDETIEQIIPDATAPGGKRVVTLSGPVQGQVDPATVTNLTGGLKELADIPSRYGGDGGVTGSSVFDQAIGGLQGSRPEDESWYNLFGMSARGVGGLWAKLPWVAGPASSTPDEVRRAIDGATNTVAANVKKLIKPPGSAEGTWSEGDQKYLMTIVGDLLKTKDLTSYNRELGNMTRRINANFGTNLSLPDGSTPEKGLKLTKPISSLTADELTVLVANMDKLSPDQKRAASDRLRILREAQLPKSGRTED